MLGTLFGPREIPLVKGAHVYFSQNGIVVVALHQNSSGILFEQAEAQNIEGKPDAAQLGAAFREAFDLFSVKDRDPTGATKAEWPAFLASKLSSVRSFESSYRLMTCMSLNSSNSVVRATIAHPAANGVELSLSFNPLLTPQALGEQLLKLVAVADDT
jgi:hypothetical protein